MQAPTRFRDGWVGPSQALRPLSPDLLDASACPEDRVTVPPAPVRDVPVSSEMAPETPPVAVPVPKASTPDAPDFVVPLLNTRTPESPNAAASLRKKCVWHTVAQCST